MPYDPRSDRQPHGWQNLGFIDSVSSTGQSASCPCTLLRIVRCLRRDFPSSSASMQWRRRCPAWPGKCAYSPPSPAPPAAPPDSGGYAPATAAFSPPRKLRLVVFVPGDLPGYVYLHFSTFLVTKIPCTLSSSSHIGLPGAVIFSNHLRIAGSNCGAVLAVAE